VDRIIEKVDATSDDDSDNENHDNEIGWHRLLLGLCAAKMTNLVIELVDPFSPCRLFNDRNSRWRGRLRDCGWPCWGNDYNIGFGIHTSWAA
jgi:hypothetical protein